MRAYEVWLQNQLVGHLREGRKGARFSYAPELVESYSGAPLLSLSLPVKERSFGESKTENWFSGLLPEGDRRNELCRELGISRYDWLGLLGEIGWECAGAVRVFPEDDNAHHEGTYEKAPIDVLAERLTAIGSRQVHRKEGTYRISLGGFQDKVCVAMPRFTPGIDYVSIDEALLPVGDAPSTHIIKPEPIAYPGLPEPEAWAMTAAAGAARCSTVALLDAEGAPKALVVERYDRAGEDWPNDIRRLHQEDGCQALGIAASDKYASTEVKGSDPTYRALAGLLVRYAEDPLEELDELLRQMVVNYVLGNWDAHAKNVSFLYQKSMLPTVAPMYDIVPVVDIEKRTNLLSLRIGGSLNPADVARGSILTEAESWGVPQRRAQSVLDRCLEGLEAGLVAANDRYPSAAKRHFSGAKKRLRNLVR